MFLRSFCLVAVLCLLAYPVFSQELPDQVIKLPQFFVPPSGLETSESYQVRCFDHNSEPVLFTHPAFLDIISKCECYANSDRDDLLYTYVRLSPIIWERTDHRDHGRARLFVDQPGQIYKTDTSGMLAGQYAEGRVVQYYKLRPCQ